MQDMNAVNRSGKGETVRGPPLAVPYFTSLATNPIAAGLLGTPGTPQNRKGHIKHKEGRDQQEGQGGAMSRRLENV